MTGVPPPIEITLVPVSPPREVGTGVWWIPSCLGLPVLGKQVHVHNSPYLILGSERSLLWDSGDPTAWRGIDASIEKLLDGRPLDYLVPSHQEIPHSGNVSRLLAKYPELRLVGDVRDYHLLFPKYTDRLVPMPAGTRIELGGGHVFVLLDAIIKDLPATQWGYEESQQVLFSADAFAFSHHPPLDDEDRPIHLPEECARFASEFGVEPGPDQIVWITRAALYWARFLRMDTYLPAFEDLLRRLPTKIVAPAHGSVIDDMSLIPVIWKALNLAYDPEGAVAAAGLAVGAKT